MSEGPFVPTGFSHGGGSSDTLNIFSNSGKSVTCWVWFLIGLVGWLGLTSYYHAVFGQAMMICRRLHSLYLCNEINATFMMGSPLHVHYITFIRLLSSYSFPTLKDFLTPTQQSQRPAPHQTHGQLSLPSQLLVLRYNDLIAVQMSVITLVSTAFATDGQTY